MNPNMVRKLELVKRAKGVTLNIGATGGSKKLGENLHFLLTKNPNVTRLVGIDIDAKAVEKFKKMGYEIYLMNAESFELNINFDTIIAGELIEHLSNPGLFLDRCYKHLKPNGRLIVSTPNPFAWWMFRDVLFNKLKDLWQDHVVLFDPTHLTRLAYRHGFETVEIKYITGDKLSKFLNLFLPERILAWDFIAVMVKKYQR